MGADILKRVAAVWRSACAESEEEFYMVFRESADAGSSRSGGMHVRLETPGPDAGKPPAHQGQAAFRPGH